MKDDFLETGEWTQSPRAFLIERHMADTMRTAHWHDHIEINLLLDGSMTYLFNGRQEYVEAGRLVLFWAAIPHQTIFVTPDAPLICIYLPLVDFLALPIGKTARQAVMQGAFITQRTRQQMTSVTATQWIDEWEAGCGARRRLVLDEVKLAVRRLSLEHMDNGAAPNRPGSPVNTGCVQLLTELISAQFAGPLTLASLSKAARVHPTTASRAFRDVLGISVMEYLARYRLTRAMQRLAETDDPIVEIAHDCGFGSQARFYDVFKQRTGTTPRQFRLGAHVTPARSD